MHFLSDEMQNSSFSIPTRRDDHCIPWVKLQTVWGSSHILLSFPFLTYTFQSQPLVHYCRREDQNVEVWQIQTQPILAASWGMISEEKRKKRIPGVLMHAFSWCIPVSHVHVYWNETWHDRFQSSLWGVISMGKCEVRKGLGWQTLFITTIRGCHMTKGKFCWISVKTWLLLI